MAGFARWRRRRDVVCREAVELVTDYLEDRLPARDRARLDAHLALCPHCTEYFREMRTMIAALGRIEPDALPSEAVDDLVAVYRRYQSG